MGVSNVIEFPDVAGRQWAAFEAELAGNLETIGAGKAAKDRVLARMKALHQALPARYGFQFRLQLPPTVNEADHSTIQAAVSEQLGAQVMHYIQDRTHEFFRIQFEAELDHCRELGLM